MYSIFIIYKVINFQSISFKEVSLISAPQTSFMTSLCNLFLGCRLSIHSHFHHPEMCFLKTQIVCIYLLLHTRMLIFCSLYAFDQFPDSSTYPLSTILPARKYVFLYIIQPDHLFQIHSGQVNSFFYYLRM